MTNRPTRRLFFLATCAVALSACGDNDSVVYSQEQLDGFAVKLVGAIQAMPEGKVVHSVGSMNLEKRVLMVIDIGATDAALKIIAASGVPRGAVRIQEEAIRPTTLDGGAT